MSADSAMLAGFDDPVHGAQESFRAILDAMSRPGSVVPIAAPSEYPEELGAAAAAVLLTLADYTTPIMLMPDMATDVAVAYLRFHTGAPIVTDPAKAGFAVVGCRQDHIDVEAFNPGEPDYPDRSTTLIIPVECFGEGQTVKLTGPGIATETAFAVAPLPDDLWPSLARNADRFPLGIDTIFTAPGLIAAVPRSTRIEI